MKSTTTKHLYWELENKFDGYKPTLCGEDSEGPMYATDSLEYYYGIYSTHDPNLIFEAAVKDLEAITGQKPVVTKARKSIAGFKLREGQPIGCKVTLRGENMYNFMDKLIKLALPRVRDFRGISKTAFDGRGNYTLGIKEQLIFPEINYDEVVKVTGMDIVFVTTAKTNEEALHLLNAFGLPFRK